MDKAVGTKKFSVILCFWIFAFSAGAQINAGRIVFERKTNLEKKFTDERMKQWLGGNKSKIDQFELIFNDTISIFKPILSDEVDKLAWATSKNTVVQNFASNNKMTEFDMQGSKLYVTDVNKIREWKITDSKRTIGNYKCRKAVFQKDDSTRIYAWYAMEIVPSIGPEGFSGLPGAILGLATEDGGIIYFAKEVEILAPKQEDFILAGKKKEVYTPTELRTKLEKDLSGSPWGQRIIDEIFRWL